MSVDLRQLRPSKLAGLLNSTPLGEVTSEARVRRNVIRAGLRAGDTKRVNVLAYAAWLLSTWHAGNGQPESGLSGYEAKRERERARNAAASASGRDIGPIPDVEDAERKAQIGRAHV